MRLMQRGIASHIRKRHPEAVGVEEADRHAKGNYRAYFAYRLRTLRQSCLRHCQTHWRLCQKIHPEASPIPNLMAYSGFGRM